MPNIINDPGWTGDPAMTGGKISALPVLGHSAVNGCTLSAEKATK